MNKNPWHRKIVGYIVFLKIFFCFFFRTMELSRPFRLNNNLHLFHPNIAASTYDAGCYRHCSRIDTGIWGVDHLRLWHLWLHRETHENPFRYAVYCIRISIYLYTVVVWRPLLLSFCVWIRDPQLVEFLEKEQWPYQRSCVTEGKLWNFFFF